MHDPAMMSDSDLDLIFRNARSVKNWTNRPVSNVLLRALWELTCLGPTAFNSQPLRVVFVKSQNGKEKLKAALMDGNIASTMAAPVTAILAVDTGFFEHMTHNIKGPMENHETAWRNASIQGGYFIIAARALGLDCGPMSGFDNTAIDDSFFFDGRFKSNFLVNLGYGNLRNLPLRDSRLDFDTACTIT